MSQSLVAITGATSMSAMWIARAFSLSGFDVHGLCSKHLSDYDGLKKRRLHYLKSFAKLHFNLRSESGSMENWITEYKPQLWIHHHHHMENYRLQTYDLNQSQKMDLAPLPGIVKTLSGNGCQGILLSGSYFEPGEGDPRATPTPYGKSKLSVSQNLEKLTKEFSITFSKVVIPDVVGPLEDQGRFIPKLVDCAKRKEVFVLSTPDQVADHLPAETLGFHYVDTARALLEGRSQITRPSGWVGSNKEWADQVRINLLNPSGLELKITTPVAGSANNIHRANNPSEKLNVNWNQFWKGYEKYLETDKPW